MAAISGSVTYVERIMLPPTATVEVTMSDVSRVDAPAEVLATATFPVQGGPPFPFVLDYDPTLVTAHGRYVVRATIRARGRLLYTSTEQILALDLDPDRPIVLSRVDSASRVAAAVDPVALENATQGGGAAPDVVTAPDVSVANTYWRVLELDGVPVPRGAGGREAHLVLEEGSEVARGFAGCNAFRGPYRMGGSTLRLGPLSVTRMMCVEGMDLEQGLLEALRSVTSFQIRGDRLSLADSAGVVRVVLQAVALI